MPLKGETGGEPAPLGAPGRGGVDFPLCGQRRDFFLFLASQETVLRMRGAEREGQAFYYFVFQIENLLLAIYDTQVSSQAHSVPQCWGKTLRATARGRTGKRGRSIIYDRLCGVLACAGGQLQRGTRLSPVPCGEKPFWKAWHPHVSPNGSC